MFYFSYPFVKCLSFGKDLLRRHFLFEGTPAIAFEFGICGGAGGGAGMCIYECVLQSYCKAENVYKI